MASSAQSPTEDVARELTPEEEEASFNWLAQYFLGITGSEFLAKYRRGEYEPLDQHAGVIEVAHHIPKSFAADSQRNQK